MKYPRIVSKRLNCYPGDKTIQIQKHIKDSRGNVWVEGLFNIYLVFKRGFRYYENDNYNVIFNTIAEAKQFARDRL